MLSATSIREFAGSRLTSNIFLERKLRAHVVRRERLLYDTAYAPPARSPNKVVHLFAQLSGTLFVKSDRRADLTRLNREVAHEIGRAHV